MQAEEKRQDRGFTQLAAVVAVLLSMASLLAVAFKLDDSNSAPAATNMTMSGGGMHRGVVNGNAGGAVSSSDESIKLTIKSDEEEGKLGSDGNWHDSFLPADFSVKAGATVTVVVYNYDDMPHTFSADDLGANEEIAGGSESKPSKTVFTFQAPQQAGSYEWYCALPCDPWAMTHEGFMKGHVTVA